MGYSISWLAVRGISKQFAFTRMGLVLTGETGDRDDFEACGRTMADGWTVVMFGRVYHPLTLAGRHLSRGCSLLACAVDEHQNVSDAAFWRDGIRIWQATHMAEISPYHLEAEGTLPRQFGVLDLSARARQLREPGVDHMFGVPLALAETVSSFRYDRAQPGDEEFEELRPGKP